MKLSLVLALCALSLSACPAAVPVAERPDPAGDDQDGDGFSDANDACPTVAGNSNGCPDETVAPPPPTGPTMTPAAARAKLERVVARTEKLYPHFTADGGPRGVLPALDAIRVADASTKARARGLIDEAQAAYDALTQATSEKSAAEQAMIDEAKQNGGGGDDGGWFGGTGGDTSSAKRFLAASDLVDAARAKTNALDERLVAALRDVLASAQ